MAYLSDHEASSEAAKYKIADDQLQALRAQLADHRGSVGDHRVSFSQKAWNDVAQSIPIFESTTGTNSLSRGQIINLAKLVLDGAAQPRDLLAATYIWGWGLTGFGRSRYDAIIQNSGGDPNTQLRIALDALGQDSPIKAYELLLGGTETKKRTRLGTPGYARIKAFGPAFYTKYLYFASAALADQGHLVAGPTALILDSRLARRVNELTRRPERPSGIRYLVHSDGRVNLWSCYRYAVYLHWMAQTADRLNVATDVLEYTLFETTSPIPTDEDSDK